MLGMLGFQSISPAWINDFYAISGGNRYYLLTFYLVHIFIAVSLQFSKVPPDSCTKCEMHPIANREGVAYIQTYIFIYMCIYIDIDIYDTFLDTLLIYLSCNTQGLPGKRVVLVLLSINQQALFESQMDVPTGRVSDGTDGVTD